METIQKRISKVSVFLLAGTLFAAGCAGGPLSTREKGAGIGALGGSRRADLSALLSVTPALARLSAAV